MPERKSGKPSLSRAEAERVRRALARLHVEKFKGNKTELGRALGRSQPAVTQLLDGTNLASLDTARRVAKLEGVSVTMYLDEHANDDTGDEPFPAKMRAAQSARGLLLPDWAIEQMLSEPPPPGLSSDPGPMFWFRRVEQLVSAPRTSPDDGSQNRSRPHPKGRRRT